MGEWRPKVGVRWAWGVRGSDAWFSVFLEVVDGCGLEQTSEDAGAHSSGLGTVFISSQVILVN